MRNEIITSPTIDEKISEKRAINGYIISIKYTQGKTLYQCMERAIKEMSDSLKYKALWWKISVLNKAQNKTHLKHNEICELD